ncbi:MULTISPECIES: hypothetical protein [Vagococcus]|uniref:Uncharacterized protein n=1 Tax=Vagococcus fluvialis bH819 TaxID=1255619 RepID=A0A1X6WU15_9ENTE|nr:MULTISPECIES: hypothetical protein [Vagococcus]SLM87116.1 hypothetical protein FM121_13540 [Vagococcus fluvialis bH819]
MKDLKALKVYDDMLLLEKIKGFRTHINNENTIRNANLIIKKLGF